MYLSALQYYAAGLKAPVAIGGASNPVPHPTSVIPCQKDVYLKKFEHYFESSLKVCTRVNSNFIRICLNSFARR